MSCCIESTLHLCATLNRCADFRVYFINLLITYKCLTDASCNDSFQLNSTCYKVHKTERVDWFTAVNRCRSNNASLAVFDDYIRKNFPSSLLSNNTKVWIGLMKSWWTWPGLLLLLFIIFSGV